MLLLVVAWTVGHIQGDRKFLASATCASTFLVGILRMIKIIIIIM